MEKLQEHMKKQQAQHMVKVKGIVCIQMNMQTHKQKQKQQTQWVIRDYEIYNFMKNENLIIFLTFFIFL